MPVIKWAIINYAIFANIRLETKMLQKFRAWYLKNQTEITWFLIGWLALGGLYDFLRGEYVGAIVLWGIAVINYVLTKKS